METSIMEMVYVYLQVLVCLGDFLMIISIFMDKEAEDFRLREFHTNPIVFV